MASRNKKGKVHGIFKSQFHISFFHKPTMEETDIYYYIILEDVIFIKMRLFNPVTLIIEELQPLTSSYLENEYERLFNLLKDQTSVTVLVSLIGNTSAFRQICLKYDAPVIEDERFADYPANFYTKFKNYCGNNPNRYGFFLIALKEETFNTKIPDDDEIEEEEVVKEVSQVSDDWEEEEPPVQPKPQPPKKQQKKEQKVVEEEPEQVDNDKEPLPEEAPFTFLQALSDKRGKENIHWDYDNKGLLRIKLINDINMTLYRRGNEVKILHIDTQTASVGDKFDLLNDLKYIWATKHIEICIYNVVDMGLQEMLEGFEFSRVRIGISAERDPNINFKLAAFKVR